MSIQEHNTQTATPTPTVSASTALEDPIRIYVACLAAYNNGILHGAWIDAQQDADDLQWAIWDMLKASPIEGAEEWAIHDYEGFEGAPVSEFTGMQEIADLAAFIDEHGAIGGKLIEYYGTLNDARTAIEDHYAGEYVSLADFAEEMTQQRGDVPDHLASYIDYERMGRDLEMGGDVTAIETGFEQIHIFWAW